MSLRPIETLKLTLNDGKEYRFLLSAGGVKRTKERLGVQTLKDILDRDAVGAGIPILWEAMLDKPEGWTEDSFSDQLPADMEGLTKSVMHLLGFSFPDPNNRPTGGAPAETTEAPKTTQ